MEYLKLGMVLAIISVPRVVYYWLTMKDGYVEESTKWWNGENYDGSWILLEIIMTILVGLLTFLLVLVGYPIIIGVAIITMIVISLRNKRLAKIKNKRDGIF
jgi:hypothetical protein